MNWLKQKTNSKSFSFAVAALLLLFLSLQLQAIQIPSANAEQLQKEAEAYPATPEKVVEAFIEANYSEEAIKRYWLDITDDNALKKYKKNYGIYFDCKELDGYMVSKTIRGNFTIKRNKNYNIENDTTLKLLRRHGITDEMREKARKGEIAEVSVFFNLTAFFKEKILPSGVKKSFTVSRMSYGIGPGCLDFLLIKSNDLWKIESTRFTNEECAKALEDYYAKLYKDKKIKGDYSIMTDTPISEACLIEGVKNKIEKYKDDKEFVNGLEDCLKAIEEKTNCRAFSKK